MTDPAPFLATAARAADAAGAILRGYFRAGLPTERKPDDSPVTRADREAEQAMRAIIRAAHPDHAIMGEEGGREASGPDGDAPYRWVLDPIDGTRAFITGRPLWGTLIALMHGPTPILGLLDQPITAERWTAARGTLPRLAGAFTGTHGTLGTRTNRTLAECELACTSPLMFPPPEAAAFAALSAAVARVTYGGDCYLYGLLALGQIDIVAEAGLHLWDWAALLPIVTAAGGCLTGWAGEPLTPSHPGRVLALANPALLDQVVQRLAATKDIAA